MSSADQRVVEQLRDFLARAAGRQDVEILGARRHVGGLSWETWELEVRNIGTERLIVRRVPECGLLDSYDVEQQWSVNEALERAGAVPIARALWVDVSGEATGRPFVVFEHVAGSVPSPWNIERALPDPGERREVVLQLARVAAAVHATDITEVSFLRGATDGPAAEVDYWERIYRRDARTLMPAMELGFAWLRARVDDCGERRTLVHGDLRVGNFIVDGGRIVALLDWEGVHVGDPVEDLAHAAMPLFGESRGSVSGVAFDDFLETYEQASGQSVERMALRFWTIFANVQFVVSFVTAARRFEDSRTSDARYAALSTNIPTVLGELLEDLRESIVSHV
jgi:aminoglycoside phosphotransferase (APT) family kinase protein